VLIPYRFKKQGANVKINQKFLVSSSGQTKQRCPDLATFLFKMDKVELKTPLHLEFSPGFTLFYVSSSLVHRVAYFIAYSTTE